MAMFCMSAAEDIVCKVERGKESGSGSVIGEGGRDSDGGNGSMDIYKSKGDGWCVCWTGKVELEWRALVTTLTRGRSLGPGNGIELTGENTTVQYGRG
jgi:hypothetical protein